MYVWINLSIYLSIYYGEERKRERMSGHDEVVDKQRSDEEVTVYLSINRSMTISLSVYLSILIIYQSIILSIYLSI